MARRDAEAAATVKIKSKTLPSLIDLGRVFYLADSFRLYVSVMESGSIGILMETIYYGNK